MTVSKDSTIAAQKCAARIGNSQIQKMQVAANATVEIATELAPSLTQMLQRLEIMIPENAGGKAFAKQSIEILAGSEPIPQRQATKTIMAGVKSKRQNVFQSDSLSIENLTVESDRPAANTATPELALAIRSKLGANEAGILMPNKTRTKASNGAAATGFLMALIIADIVELLVFFSPLPK